jgi:hypothetical protein
VALYSNGAKADFRFETTSLAQSADRELRVLKDTGRWAETFQRPRRLAPAQPYISPAELTELDDRFDHVLGTCCAC